MVGPVVQVVGLPVQVAPFQEVPVGQDMPQGRLALMVTGTTLVAVLPHELVALKLNVVVPFAHPAVPHAYPTAVIPVGPVPTIAPVQETMLVSPVPPEAFQSQAKGVPAVTLALEAPLTAMGNVIGGQLFTVKVPTAGVLEPHALSDINWQL